MKFKKLYINKDYFTFLCTLFFASTLLVGFFIYDAYQAQVTDKHRRLRITGNEIAINLDEFLTQISEIVLSFGKHISSGNTTPVRIANVLGKKSENHYPTDFLSKIDASWISNNDFMTFNNQYGVLDNPTNMSFRSYVKACKKVPWKLHFSKPAVGTPGGLWQIPAGMGITDSEGKYVGIIAIGLNIAELNSKIHRISFERGVSFVLLDDQYRIILQSLDNELDPNSTFYRDYFSENSLFLNDEGILKNPLIYKGINYSYYKKINNYPYILLMGFDNIILQNELKNSIFPHLMEFVGIGILILILFFLFHKRILKLSQLSQKTRESFTHQLKSDMDVFINTIIAYSAIIKKYYNGEIEVGVDEKRLRDLIEEIFQSALNLRVFTTDFLNFNYVCVNSIINEVITMQSQKLAIKNIKVKTSLIKELPRLWADELRLKQILGGLISLSIKCTQKKGCMKIINHLSEENSSNTLYIIIEDNGFTLDEDDFERIDKKSDCDLFKNDIYGLGLEYPAIKELVKLHSGCIKVERLEKRGKKFILTFPYINPSLRMNGMLNNSKLQESQVLQMFKDSQTTSIS